MSTPYHYTPRMPAAPHPTPLSASGYTFPNAKSGRTPIHNPYDKFTQPEFDAWIGGITGALRRALGQDEESQEQENRADNGLDDSRHHQIGVEESDDEPPDDSFAEIKARRAKGKARDPREGPGLGKGDSVQPIEIVSSDEEDAQEVEISMVQDEGSDYEDEEDEEAQYQSEEEEEEYSWEQGQSSSHPLPSPKVARKKEIVQEEDEEEEEDGYYEEGGEYEEYDEEAEAEYDEEDQEEEEQVQPVRAASDEVIEIISDDDEEAGVPARKAREESFEYEDDRRQGEVEEASDEYEEDEYEDDHQLLTSQLIYPPQDLIRRPRDDVDEAEEEGDVLEDGDEIEELQPIAQDTSFFSQPSLAPIEPEHVEIQDPWSGPRTYAEDFYSGADICVAFDGKLDAHHLGPTDAEKLDADKREQVDDTDVIQPFEENTSFPPQQEGPEAELDLPDPWEGPKTYAEDLYSGGDVRLSPSRPANAHYLGAADDVDYVEDLSAGVAEVVDSEEVQPFDKDTSFLHQDDELEPPIELPDPWSGPQIYAEDFYSGGDVRTMPGHQIDPSLLSGTGDVEDDIDNFLTPGVLTPNPSEERVSFADASTSQEEEDDQVIRPPTNHDIPFTLRRNQPIPADAELISIDDSDDEQDKDSTSGFVDDDAMSLTYPDSDEGLHDEHSMEENIQEEVDELADDDVSELPIESDAVQDEVVATDKESERPEVSSELEHREENTPTAESSPSQPGYKPLARQLAEDHNMIGVDTASEYNQQQPADTAGIILPAKVVEPETASEHTVDDESALNFVIDSEPQGVVVIEDLPPIVEQDVVDDMGDKAGDESAAAENVVAGVEELNEVDLQDGKSSSEFMFDYDHQESVLTVPEQNASDPNLDLEQPGRGVVDNSFESNNDDVRSISHLDEEMVQQVPTYPVASTSTAPSQPHTHGQLPTPPSEKGRYASLPPMVEGEALLIVPSPSKEQEDDDADIPQPVLAEATEVEIEIDISVPKPSEYSVEEMDGVMDEDAEREWVDLDDDISLVSVKDSTELLDAWDEEIEGYSRFEEPRTVGRLTEELADREISLGVVSVSPEEAAAFHESGVKESDADKKSSAGEAASHGAPGEDSVPSTEQIFREEGAILMPGTDSTTETSISVSAPTFTEIPMPITADASVPDPVDSVSQQNLPAEPVATSLILDPVLTPQPIAKSGPESFSIPPTLEQSSQQDQNGDSETLTRADGLFTPAESSVNTASNEPQQENMHSRILTSLAQALFGPGSSPAFFGGQADTLLQSMTSTPKHGLSPAPSLSLPDVPLPLRVGDSPGVIEPASTIEEDVFGEVQLTSPHSPATNRAPTTPIPTSLPFRAPSLSVGPTLTRKPTDPILMADPYPYSLSTPATSMYGGQEEASEEDTGLDNSTSSNSTLEKMPEDKDSPTVRDGVDGLELEYPTKQVHLAEFGSNIAIPLSAAQAMGSSKERHDSKSSDEGPSFSEEILTTQGVGQDVKDKSLVGNGGKQVALNKQYTPSVSSSSSSPIIPGPASQPEAGPSKQTSKRKRDSSAGHSQKADSLPKPPKGKGRKSSKSERRKSQTKNLTPEPMSEETIVVKPRPLAKINEPVKRAPSEVSQGSQASSGASVALRMLQPTSRSSSIASSVRSPRSVVSQPSPTVNKPNALPPQPSAPPAPPPPPPPPPVSLFHAHGQKRKALAQKLSQTLVPQVQNRKADLSRVSSVPNIPEASTSDILLSPFPIWPPVTIPAQAPSIPTQTPNSAKPAQTPSRQVSTTISPVTRSTRSQCRYHRISLPKEEGGPRVCFLVPGCSLNDKELMEEEEIEDHGDATQEDSQRMVNDIESLGFDLNLIGIIRQLVGLDILREQEVFFLPQPGEEVHRKIPFRKSERSAMVKAPGDSSSHAGSPSHSASIRSPSLNRAPPSIADSTSTSLSTLRKVIDSEKGSTAASMDSASEPTDNEEPGAKRLRPSPPGEHGVMGPPTTHKKKKYKTKRSKKLDQTYQPEEDPEEASDAEKPSLRKRRKSGVATRGVKRTRTSDVVALTGDGTEQRESKRLRAQLTETLPLQPSAT